MTAKTQELIRQYVQKLKRNNQSNERCLPQELLEIMVEDWNLEFERFPDEQITQSDLLESMGLT